MGGLCRVSGDGTTEQGAKVKRREEQDAAKQKRRCEIGQSRRENQTRLVGAVLLATWKYLSAIYLGLGFEGEGHPYSFRGPCAVINFSCSLNRPRWRGQGIKVGRQVVCA